jgi:hypothetical protein
MLPPAGTTLSCSGCAVVNEDGIPVLLYTGVRLRSSPTCGPLPPAECDLQLPFIESQCSASPADPGPLFHMATTPRAVRAAYLRGHG